MIVEKDAFIEALAPADKLARREKDIPILSHVLLSPKDGRLTVRGSNLSEEITAAMARGFSGEPVEDFTCASQQLTEFARNAPGSEIEIRVERQDGRVDFATFLSGRARLRLPVLPAADFPDIAGGTFTHAFSCDGRVLARALRSAVHAASNDASRPYLHGVYMHAGDDGLILVATDGHRLVRQVIASIAFDEGDIADLPPVILPSGMIDRLLPIIDREQDVAVEISDSAARFGIGGVSVMSKLVDGTFPDYRRVIPQPGPFRATFDVARMSASVKRVMFVDPDKSKRVRFSFAPDRLELRASAEGGLESVDEIEIDCDSEMTIGFNGRYALDMLAHCGGERLELVTHGPGDPALFRIPGEELNLTVLMPLRV